MLSWNRAALLRCNCGADLRTEQTQSSPVNLTSLALMISHKLNQSEKGEINKFFKDLTIDQLQRLIRYLGNYMDSASGKNPLKMRGASIISNSRCV